MKRLVLISAAAFLASMLSANAADVKITEKTKANWEEHCTKCHGDDGKGNTRMGRRLKVKDYTDAKVQQELKDEEMFKQTKEGIKEGGRTKMKAYEEKLSDQEIKELIAYIRSFKK